MTTAARRRLMRDWKRICLDPPVGIIAQPEKDDLMQWQAVIFGPDDTPWEGGTFKLTMKFLEDYPNKPPTVKFITKLFHPNVYTDGAICLDILGNQWSPIYDVAAILASIQSLLTDPNPNSPANVEAAKLYVENRREYDRKVSEVIEALWKLEEEEEEEEEESANDDDDADADADASAAPSRKKQKVSESEAKTTATAEEAADRREASSSSSSASGSGSGSSSSPAAGAQASEAAASSSSSSSSAAAASSSQ